MIKSSVSDSKVLENRLRRTAARRGLMLTKSRRRDPKALDYGRYTLTAEDGHVVILGGLADVEEALR